MTTQDTENQAGSHEPSQAEVEAKVAEQNKEAVGNGSTDTDSPSTDASASTAAAGEAEVVETKVEEPSVDEVKDGGNASAEEPRGVIDAA